MVKSERGQAGPGGRRRDAAGPEAGEGSAARAGHRRAAGRAGGQRPLSAPGQVGRRPPARPWVAAGGGAGGRVSVCVCPPAASSPDPPPPDPRSRRARGCGAAAGPGRAQGPGALFLPFLVVPSSSPHHPPSPRRAAPRCVRRSHPRAEVFVLVSLGGRGEAAGRPAARPPPPAALPPRPRSYFSWGGRGRGGRAGGAEGSASPAGGSPSCWGDRT